MSCLEGFGAGADAVGDAPFGGLAGGEPGDEGECQDHQADRDAGSITRPERLLHLLRVDPIAERDDGQVGRAGDQPPDVEQDHHGRTEECHRPVADRGTEQQDHEERDGDQVRSLVDLAEELLDPAELSPPDPHDDAGRTRPAPPDLRRSGLAST